MDPITIAIITLVAIIALIVIIVLVQTSQFGIEYEDVEPINLPEVDGESVAQRIGLAVQLKTISDVDPEKVDPRPFEAFRDLIRTLYPQLEEKLTREVINRHALLYTWQGSDPSLDAVCFTAHQDVVPADEGEDSGWTHSPFAGELADGYVWGRGTLDCKGILICLLEAVNNLVKLGYQPKRTIYLAFGDDEENSGVAGAKQIVKTLKERGVRLSFLLDEGGTVTTGQIEGVKGPVAIIGISEKGYLSLKLKARVKGGHSAMPPTQTAIGALSLAIAALESNPFPQTLEVAQFTLSHLGNEVPFLQRMALANPWLFGKIAKKRLAALPSTNALTRTTAVPTIIKAGSADNVLPAEAEAVINCRIMPGETIKDVYERICDLVADEIVSVEPVHGDTIMDDRAWNPTIISDVDSPQYNRLADLILGAFPGTKVAPVMISGATDARYYNDLCSNVYRFAPFYLTKEEIGTVHSDNERVSFENAGRAVGFYQALIAQLASLTAEQEAAERDATEEEDEDLSDAETSAIDRMNEPLKVKPLDPTRRKAREEHEDLKSGEGVTEEVTWKRSVQYIDDDEPLVVKPMKKKLEE
ncbi:MAG TPA: M20/M25/M40 family metallo-hydrolase [Anaerolineaceae bacterium]|nr:M20/M25/M40 family metallo-hydrolase [Anaerolineaceae bacterium]